MTIDSYQIVGLTAILVLFCILAVACLSGCSTMTPEQLEVRQEQRYAQHACNSENWELCKAMYKQSNVTMKRANHAHRRGWPHGDWEIREDLRVNHCEFWLGDYWVEL